MLGTYLSALAAMLAAATTGQAIFALCGRRKWSWLAPAVGLAALMPIAWWAVRLPGQGEAALFVLAAVIAAGAVYLRLSGGVDGLRDAGRIALPVAGAALIAASVPFIVEGRFGILGTGLNPDMSQHLFAADRLAHSGSERLISSGYPLGPHSVAVALSALGPSLVQAFAGLTVATAVIAALSPLALLARLPRARRLVAALLVGFAYMTASYLIQGAFKETMQALFVLTFAIGLEQLTRGRLAGSAKTQAIPLGVLAVGSAYVYSFPGLLWLAGAAAAWGALELALAARDGGWVRVRRLAERATVPTALALAIFTVAIVPELGRMADFAGFETFDPDGAGLGNLFNPISPLEALGIWPSGDFRLDPGDGVAPASIYYLGGAVGLAALALGLWWWLRRHGRAVPAALGVAAALIVYARLAGTPYQEAKAIALAAPLTMMISIRALAETAPTGRQTVRIVRRRGIAQLFPRSARTSRFSLGLATLAVAFVAAAGVSTVLALVNGPVGPARWSPALLELRPLPGATLVLAPEDFLSSVHGRDFVVWELRGGRVCVEPERQTSADPAPPGIAHVVVFGHRTQPPFEGTEAGRELGPYRLFDVPEPTPGRSGCPFVSDGQRPDPGGG